LSALVIGINAYKSPDIRNLRGAVADADVISEYLTKQLNVPRSRVTNLRDAQATRDNIINSIYDLVKRDDEPINHGDPILIFYAGHGATVPARAEGEAGSNNIQCIVPHDCRVNVWESVIPDRILGALLHKLADAKGDNIVRVCLAAPMFYAYLPIESQTVIFDCCHSGSATRMDDVMAVLDPTRISRGIELKPDKIPVGLDQSIWINENEERATAIASGFSHTGLYSHVLLTACGADEPAREQKGRGLFTSALLEVLSQVDPSKVTYTDLMKRIPHIPG
jgi:Caspase domain